MFEIEKELIVESTEYTESEFAWLDAPSESNQSNFFTGRVLRKTFNFQTIHEPGFYKITNLKVFLELDESRPVGSRMISTPTYDLNCERDNRNIQGSRYGVIGLQARLGPDTPPPKEIWRQAGPGKFVPCAGCITTKVNRPTAENEGSNNTNYLSTDIMRFLVGPGAWRNC